MLISTKTLAGVLKTISLAMCILVGEAYACKPLENTREERLYALLAGINGWIGIENTVWLGEEMHIRIEFISPEEDEDFHRNLPYEVGATPTAMNQSEKMQAAPCLFAIGSFVQEKSEQTSEGTQSEKNHPNGRRPARLDKPDEEKYPTLRIKHWFVTTPYLLSKNELVEGQDLEVDVKQHLSPFHPDGTPSFKSAEKYEYSLTKTDMEPQNDYHQLIGLYPVIGMELESEEVVVLLSGSGTPPLCCKVQFKDKEEAVRFFQKDNQQKIIDAKRAGEPPVFYLIGRYDMTKKAFIADKFLHENEIMQEIIHQFEENTEARKL